MSIFSRLITAHMRRSWAKGDAKRDAGLTTPDDVVRFDDLIYGPDPRWNVLDIYRPRDVEGKLTTVVSFHGGGYFYGDKDLYQFYCMELAQLGYAVVNFTYHLAPESYFPQPLLDADLVFRFMLDHAGEYGLDLDRVILVGDSAGAQLASHYAAAQRDPAFAALLGLTTPVRIAALGLNCGYYDMAARAKGPSGAMMNNYIPPKAGIPEAQLDVLAHIGADYPPTYLMSAPGDFLVSQMAPMEELLRTRGVPVAAKRYGDKNTGHVFHVDVRSPLGREANREQLTWLSEHI